MKEKRKKVITTVLYATVRERERSRKPNVGKVRP